MGEFLKYFRLNGPVGYNRISNRTDFKWNESILMEVGMMLENKKEKRKPKYYLPNKYLCS